MFRKFIGGEKVLAGGLIPPTTKYDYFSVMLQTNSGSGRLVFRFLDHTQFDAHTHTHLVGLI